MISSTSEAFRAFEKRYGDKLPQVRGDWTPYWEDGAGSSAAETAMNRASSERLAQAETLWAMLNPSAYPKTAFDGCVAERVALFRAHLGRMVQHLRSGQCVHHRPVDDQTVLRHKGQPAIAAIAQRSGANGAWFSSPFRAGGRRWVGVKDAAV